MRLLQVDENRDFSLTDDLINNIPPYAILSHTWGEDHEEVNFNDLTKGPRKTKAGYKKLHFCAEQAARDGLQYTWVDTCCIDKSNNTELSEAINSMFRWYRDAAKCYVYLLDVSTDDLDQAKPQPREPAFRRSRWFTRGWTLQELIAPSSVEFFCSKGIRLGDKKSLERQLHEITGIAVPALQGTPLSEFSVEERMSWAEKRETKREEDKAYSLLGIFNIHMPLIYGEGSENAFVRLREEINKRHGGDPLNRLPVANDAPFNSFSTQHAPSCLPDTRVGLLREIYDWANTKDERCIFWLNGLAGTGKSTIARTVAREYFERKNLGASFFFSRGGGDVSHAGKFVTSIALQLASSIPTLHQHICDAVTDRSDIASQSLRDQWHQLVLGPLSKLDGASCQSLYVLVVDALDECDDDANIRTVLQLLVEARLLKKVRLRAFLTSRPEIPIRYGFYQIPDAEHQEFVLHNISPSIIDHDISIFLEYNFRIIRQERSLDAGWPGEKVIRRLVQIACGLFIWAATTCRFIREGKRFATKRLDTILEGNRSAVTAPEKHLNEIYTTVLKHSISPEYTNEEQEELYSILRQTLGSIVILFSPLSVCSLSRLFCVPTKDIDQSLEDLHSVLDVPKDQNRPLRLHHPSFRDFLLNNDRCKDPNFWVDEKQAHQRLADSCIQLMSTHLKQDICSVDSPGRLATDVESSRVEQYLPLEAQYACLYWVEHIQKSGDQLQEDKRVDRFLQEHLLHWLEALGWMRKVSEGIHAIASLESIAATQECPRLSEYIHDIKRFVLYNRLAIENAPLQTYSSALIFAPAMSIVKKQFKDCVPRWIQRLPKVENNWNALLQTLEGHLTFVRAVAFSPDSKLLASASNDRTIKLWDAGSGAVLQTLEGHSDHVSAVAFSLDGKLLASASSDRTVKLWDARSEVVLQTLKGHLNRVNAVVFSPDSKLLASASDDNTVKLWDTRSGAVLQTLKGHATYINTVAFSPDGKLLASALNDWTVKLWDARSGAVLQTLEGHSDHVNAVAFSPDGKLLASASNDRTVKLWDARLEVALQTLEGHLNRVNAITFSPDGKLIASASNDRTVKLWDAGSGAVLRTLEGHLNRVNAVAFSPDGKLLASASNDRTVKVWEAGSEAVLQTLESHSHYVNAVNFSLDGKLLASASDNTIKLWDAESEVVLQTLKGHSYYVNAVAFSPDGKLLASASDDETVKLWNVGSEAAGSEAVLQTLKGHSYYVNAVAFSPDGKLLASASSDETVKLWDAESGAVLQTLKGHSHYVRAVAFSPDSKLLASASSDETVKLWNAESGAVLQTLEVDTSILTLSFSNDGTFLQTDRGPIYTEFLSNSATLPRPTLLHSIFAKEQWVGMGIENILWLPSEHWPSRVAVHGSIVGFGYSSGRVTFMEFVFGKIPLTSSPSTSIIDDDLL